MVEIDCAELLISVHSPESVPVSVGGWRVTGRIPMHG